MKEFTNINAIEAMTVEEARELAKGNVEKVKDHDVYFVDLGEPFGFSALVFYGDRHIYYANDYQLHHSCWPKEHLKERYIELLNNVLFTEDEIAGPVGSHDEYSRKSHFLHNYYGMREEYVSIFMIAPSEKEETDHQRAIEGRVFNPVTFGYYKPEKKAFVDRCIELQKALNQAKDAMSEDFEYQKGAFLREMFNHEYGYCGSPDYTVLQVFGRLNYRGDTKESLEEYFKQLGFSDTRKAAYHAALKEYWDRVEL